MIDTKILPLKKYREILNYIFEGKKVLNALEAIADIKNFKREFESVSDKNEITKFILKQLDHDIELIEEIYNNDFAGADKLNGFYNTIITNYRIVW